MIYEYRCEDCTKVFEVWAKVADAPPSECPNCKSPKVSKVISSSTFALKGSGWYTTDYKRSGGDSGESGGSGSSGK